ncbi:MAG: hypothetical protein H0X16_09295 [Chloroflexi bacterium]|nr:hypothetical protein [Chloroflexota bacterium]
MEILARLVRALLWLIAATIIALGAGGIVIGADHPPTDQERPELTSRADARMRPGLTNLTEDLVALEVRVGELSDSGRAALTQLASRDAGALRDTLTEGTGVVEQIRLQEQALRAKVAALPYQATSDRIGGPVREQLERIQEAIDTVRPLGFSWRAFDRAARPAVRLVELLELHDRQTFAATQAGTRADYPAALDGLRDSLATLDESTELRDRLAEASAVDTLDEWLTRNRRYDGALLALYQALEDSGGVPNDAARAAFADVEAARGDLPPDTRALVIIMSDIAQGGLNQAAIAIEQARGALARATATLD